MSIAASAIEGYRITWQYLVFVAVVMVALYFAVAFFQWSRAKLRKGKGKRRAK